MYSMAPLGFDWDQGNREKNWIRHGVTMEECEEAFANTPRVVTDDPGHSATEMRYSMLGKTNAARAIHIIFTVRGDFIRVISARDQSRKERSRYEQAEKPKEV